MKAVSLTLLEEDDILYIEDENNLEDDEPSLYTMPEFCAAIAKKGKLSPAVASCLLSFLSSASSDLERDVKHLERAYNIAHGLA